MSQTAQQRAVAALTSRAGSLGLLALVLLLHHLSAASAGLVNTDGNGAIDIANNLLAGKGLVSGFNLYQSFPSPTTSALTYHQVGYPLFVAAAFSVAGESVSLLTNLNVLLLGLTLVLLDDLLRRRFSPVVATSSLLVIALSDELVRTYSTTSNEPLQMLLVCGGVWLLDRGGRAALVAAIVLFSAALLTRITTVFLVGGPLLLLLGAWSRRRKVDPRLVALVASTLAVFLLLQAGTVAATGHGYPTYRAPTMAYHVIQQGRAEGLYAEAFPVLQVDRWVQTFHWSERPQAFVAHARQFSQHLCGAAYGGWVLLALVVWRLRSRMPPTGWLLLALGLGNLLGFAVVVRGKGAHYAINAAPRYVLPSLFFLAPVVLAGLEAIQGDLARRSKRGGAVLPLALAGALVFGVDRVAEGPPRPGRLVVEWLMDERVRPWRDQVAASVRTAVGEDEVVVTNMFTLTSDWKRPMVSLPLPSMATPENNAVFRERFRPACLVFYGSAAEAKRWSDALRSPDLQPTLSSPVEGVYLARLRQR